MNKTIGVFLFLAIGSVRAGDLPDPRLTPGAINPDVTQDTIQQTVCVKGYTKTIRPPMHFTNQLKKQQMRQYQYTETDPRLFEEDHLIALSIGGAPEVERNLWPEPRNSEWGADKKDELEFVLYKMVCTNEMSLKDAQQAMAHNWIAAWKQYVPSHLRFHYQSID